MESIDNPPFFSLEAVREIVGGTDYGTLGKSVAFGFLDGDDLPDLVVGAPGHAAAGCIMVFYGTLSSCKLTAHNIMTYMKKIDYIDFVF